jgi:2'-hydroxyisoflavone reductase
MSTRRLFLARAVALGGSALAFCGSYPARGSSQASKSQRFLILGGTGHVGPYFVRAAAERGHHVAVFSRGLTGADLPAGAERLVGDRTGDLKSIEGRDWDAVLDIATYGPGWVRILGAALKDHVGQYTFISTVSVYDHPERNRITDETSPVVAYHGSAEPYTVTTEGRDYGALKVLCEREAERQFPGRTLIVRPGYIAGSYDSHASLPYWLLRMQRGGEVLAAGNPSTPVQFIDVRDLAEWTVRMVEARGTGLYNAVGPVPPTDLAQVIDAARATVRVPPRVTWVPSSWLSAQKNSDPFNVVLFWEAAKGYLTGISNARALMQGLTTRSVGMTMSDELRWLQQQPSQTRIIIDYRLRADGSGLEPVTMPWSAYLDREKELLAAWHALEHRRA